MISIIIAFIIGVLILSLIIVIIIYIPEINIILITGFLYACLKSLRNDEFRDKFLIKSERKLYFFIILSLVVIVSFIVYFIIVDSSTLLYTLFFSLVIFSVEIKRIIESIIQNIKE